MNTVFSRFPGLFLCVAIFASFAPVLFYTYGRLDDMAFAHWFARDFSSTMRDIFIAQGRPLHGLILAALLYPVSTFGDLVWLRLLGLLFTCAFGLQIFSFLRREGFGSPLSWWVSLGMVVQPGMAAIVGWGICSTHIIGFMAAFAIGTRALRSSHQDGRSELLWKVIPQTILFLIPVLCLYQPAAAFVLLPPLFGWFLHGRRPAGQALLIAVSIAYLAALAIYFVGLKLIVDIWLQLNTQSDRSALVTDFSGKLRFLFNEPLSLIALSWAYFFTSLGRLVFWILFAGFIIMAIVQATRHEGARVLLSVFWIGVTLFLGLVHLIVLEANYAPFRVLTFGYVLAAFLIGFLFRGMAMQGSPKIAWMGKLLTGTVVTLAALATHHHIRVGIAQPYEREYLHYRYAFEEIMAENERLPRTILWVVPDHFDMRASINLRRLRFEFGTLSSGMEYVLPGMSWMLLNEIRDVRNRQHPMWEAHLAVETVPLRRDRFWSRIPGLPFIDGPAIFGQPASRPSEKMTNPRNHPHIGRVEALYHGWMYSPWFGIYNQWVSPGVEHSILGRVNLQLLEDGRVRMEVPPYGVIFTTPEAFPESIRGDTGDVVLLDLINRPRE
ncbi:MAG: hypothetical protein JJT96_09515 [Opitutales bacterium]|nr:hypothetical protein [Opitutales bacterium]